MAQLPKNLKEILDINSLVKQNKKSAPVAKTILSPVPKTINLGNPVDTKLPIERGILPINNASGMSPTNRYTNTTAYGDINKGLGKVDEKMINKMLADYSAQRSAINQPYIDAVVNALSNYDNAFNQSGRQARSNAFLAKGLNNPYLAQVGEKYNPLQSMEGKLAMQNLLKGARVDNVNSSNEMAGNIAMAQQLGLHPLSAQAGKDWVNAYGKIYGNNLDYNSKLAGLDNAMAMANMIQANQNARTEYGVMNKPPADYNKAIIGGLATVLANNPDMLKNPQTLQQIIKTFSGIGGGGFGGNTNIQQGNDIEVPDNLFE